MSGSNLQSAMPLLKRKRNKGCHVDEGLCPRLPLPSTGSHKSLADELEQVARLEKKLQEIKEECNVSVEKAKMDLKVRLDEINTRSLHRQKLITEQILRIQEETSGRASDAVMERCWENNAPSAALTADTLHVSRQILECSSCEQVAILTPCTRCPSRVRVCNDCSSQCELCETLFCDSDSCALPKCLGCSKLLCRDCVHPLHTCAYDQTHVWCPADACESGVSGCQACGGCSRHCCPVVGTRRSCGKAKW